MKKFALLLLLTGLLPGCVVPVIVGAATAGGAVIYDKRDFKTMGEDQQAYQNAQELLNINKDLKNCHLVVAVFYNTALLVGQAPSPAQRQEAYDIVSKVPNIKRIYNEITISGATTAMQRSSDSWVTTKVRSALLAKPGLSSNNIKIVTENGVVYLMGKVSRSEAELAADAARRITGVQKVVKVFIYD